MKEKAIFKEDIKIGRIGETDFSDFVIKKLKKKYKYCENISVVEDKDFQLLDIDFICYLNPDYTKEQLLKEITNGNDKDIEKRRENNAITFEVKTDLYCLETGNVAYEFLSFDMPGCLARCYADFIYYVCLDKNREIKKRYVINLKKWRNWIMNNLNKIDKKDTPIKVFSNTNLHVSLFLTKIENLLKEKIAKSIEI